TRVSSGDETIGMYPRQVGVCDPAPASRDEEWLLSRQTNRPLTDGIRWHVPPTPSRITTACGTRPVDLFAAGNETKPSMQVYTGVQSKSMSHLASFLKQV